MSGEVQNNEEHPNEDFITKCIGQFGIWQGYLILLTSLVRIQCPWLMVSIIFLTPRTSFICTKKFNDNNTAIIDVETSMCYDTCVEYDYKNDVFKETLLSEFDLICSNKWLASFNQSVLMLGILLGTSIYGWISDRFGRRNGLNLAIFFFVILLAASSYAPSIWWFIGIRFFGGIAAGGILVITSIISVETIGPKYRYLALCIYTLDICGQMLLILFAYFFNTWRDMIFGTFAVSTLFLSYIILLPESPRWLITKGRTDEASAILTKAAKWNGLPTDDILKQVEAMHNSLIEPDVKKYGYSGLFMSKDLRKRLILGLMLWFSLGLVYYGVYQYISFIGENIYISVALSSAMQLWVPAVSMIFNKYFNRRNNIVVYPLIAGGLFLLVLTFLPKTHWTSTAMAVVGLSWIVLAYTTVYLFTSELFPTSVRNMGLGILSSSSKCGSILAPFIANIEPRWIPSLIFSILPFVAAIFCYMLPETKNKKLDDSIIDDRK